MQVKSKTIIFYFLCLLDLALLISIFKYDMSIWLSRTYGLQDNYVIHLTPTAGFSSQKMLLYLLLQGAFMIIIACLIFRLNQFVFLMYASIAVPLVIFFGYLEIKYLLKGYEANFERASLTVVNLLIICLLSTGKNIRKKLVFQKLHYGLLAFGMLGVTSLYMYIFSKF